MIRPARVGDVPVIVALVRELADYEREPDAAVATEEDFRAALFGANPRVWCLVAEEDSEDGEGEVVGFAVWFFNFSTWRGAHGVYLEDLFVRPSARGGGHGRALLAELARIAVANDCARLEWVVLDWNVEAQGFYRSLGAAPMDEWTGWRLDGEALTALGAASLTRDGATSSVTP